MRALICAAAIALPLAPALADPASNNPYLYTCADLMAAQAETGEAKVRADLMLMWSLGVIYGRYAVGPDAASWAESFDDLVTDMAGAFALFCPRRPDMSIGEFAGRLADDHGDAFIAEENN